MTDYRIRDWFAQDNKTLLRRVTLPLRRWWMTPESQIGLLSWTLVVVVAAALIGAILTTVFAERFAEVLDTDNAWLLAMVLIVVNLVLTWAVIDMIKLYSRLWIHTRNVTDGYNDEGTANDYTMKVIDEARDWLLLYDYGEAAQGNIYSDKKVEEALLAKLQDGASKFEVSIIFKNDQEDVDKLPLVRVLKQWQREHPESARRVRFAYKIDRAEVRYKGFNRYYDEYPDHYKLNDLGYAYLTRHAEGQIRREFSYATPLAYPAMKERIQDCLDFHNAVAAASD